MKQHKDRPSTVRPHNIAIGVKVLLKQKSTKRTPQPPKFRTLPSSLREANTPDNYESDADVGPPRQQETRPSGSTHSAHEQGRLQPHQPPHITAAPAAQNSRPRKERWSLQPPKDWQRKRPATRSLTRSGQESKGKGFGRK